VKARSYLLKRRRRKLEESYLGLEEAKKYDACLYENVIPLPGEKLFSQPIVAVKRHLVACVAN